MSLEALSPEPSSSDTCLPASAFPPFFLVQSSLCSLAEFPERKSPAFSWLRDRRGDASALAWPPGALTPLPPPAPGPPVSAVRDLAHPRGGAGSSQGREGWAQPGGLPGGVGARIPWAAVINWFDLAFGFQAVGRQVPGFAEGRVDPGSYFCPCFQNASLSSHLAGLLVCIHLSAHLSGPPWPPGLS